MDIRVNFCQNIKFSNLTRGIDLPLVYFSIIRLKRANNTKGIACDLTLQAG